MKPAEAVDIASKFLALAAVVMYQLGYIDTGTLASTLSALTAVMASLLLHSYRDEVKRAIKGIGRPRLFLVKTLQGGAIPIQRGCKICGREDRYALDEMIRGGAGLEELLSRFKGIDEEELRSHLGHVEALDEEELRRRYRVKEIDLREEMFKLLERLNNLYAKLESLDQRFQEGDLNPRTYIDSIGERRQLLGKIRETIITLTQLRNELYTTEQLSSLLQRLRES